MWALTFYNPNLGLPKRERRPIWRDDCPHPRRDTDLSTFAYRTHHEGQRPVPRGRTRRKLDQHSASIDLFSPPFQPARADARGERSGGWPGSGDSRPFSIGPPNRRCLGSHAQPQLVESTAPLQICRDSWPSVQSSRSAADTNARLSVLMLCAHADARRAHTRRHTCESGSITVPKVTRVSIRPTTYPCFECSLNKRTMHTMRRPSIGSESPIEDGG